MQLPPLSLYVHIPWCIKKCPYCDFNSHAVKAGLPETTYIGALLNDLAEDMDRFNINRPLQSIFIGGGTPSLFSPEAINKLLEGIKQRAVVAEGVEVTLEANPGTFESTKFAEFNALGINRLSIGIQSFHDNLLTKLGRVHNQNEAIRAAEIAHLSGFNNFNLDLMFGLPGAKPGDSENDAATAIALAPAHISFYQLTLEPNTWFHKFPPKLPDDEFIFATQQNCQRLLAENGYAQYEISAYGKPDKQCRHNLNYWQFGDYLGVGAGAHGKIATRLPGRIIRTAKAKNPESYLNNPADNRNDQMIAVDELPLEFVMNQLRLRKGFTLDHYQNMTGLAAASLEPALSDCRQQGLISLENSYYSCSDKGWNFLDSVLEKFFP